MKINNNKTCDELISYLHNLKLNCALPIYF